MLRPLLIMLLLAVSGAVAFHFFYQNEFKPVRMDAETPVMSLAVKASEQTDKAEKTIEFMLTDSGEVPEPLQQVVKQAYIKYDLAVKEADEGHFLSLVDDSLMADVSMPVSQILSIANAMRPDEVTLGEVRVAGAKAEIALSAPVEEGEMSGVARFRRVAQQWKLVKEDWVLKVSEEYSTSMTDSNTDDALPGFERIIGRWKGGEVGSSLEWHLDFTPDYRFRAEATTGAYLEGDVFNGEALGLADDGSVPVLPGGTLFDVRVTGSSAPDAVGMVSLGSYWVSGTELRICASKPGVMKRTAMLESNEDFRCIKVFREDGSL